MNRFLGWMWAVATATLTIVAAPSATGQTAPPATSAVSPFLDEQTFAVVRVDVTKISPEELAKFLAPVLEATGRGEQEKQNVAVGGRRLLDGWREAGGRDFYLVFSLADANASQPLGVAPAASVDAAKGLAEILTGLGFAESTVVDKTAVAGSAAALRRLKTLRPTEHPDLHRALALNPEAAVQIGIGLPPEVRRVAAEFGPSLPADWKGGDVAELIEPLQWAGAAVEAPPKFSLRMVVKTGSPEGARRLKQAIDLGFAALADHPELKRLLPDSKELIAAFTPREDGDRLTVNIDGPTAERLLANSIARPLDRASTAARVSRSMGHLKHIGLAFHNYHDTYGKFTPAASRDKNGKPLLSWRVHLLPFLEQQALYQRFKLDEPWDSPHNKELIRLVPSVFVSPGSESLAAEGKTRYLAPVGPKSVFEAKEGTPIQKITDGTSNTLLVMEAAPERAVVWTQPADWEFEKPGPAIAADATEWLALFCDGSVRRLKTVLPAVTLLRILQINDGQPVGDLE